MRVVILDAERAYAENLMQVISTKWPQIAVSAITSSSQLPVQGSCGGGLCVLLYNDSDFPDLADQLEKTNGNNFREVWKLRPSGTEVVNTTAKILSRLPVAKILSCISELLPDADCRKHIEQDEPDPGPTGKVDFWLYFCLDRERSRKIIRHKIRSSLDKGIRVIYLPLMPTYNMHLIVRPDSGPGMSDLLIDMGSGTGSGQISRFWQPHPEGYYQFRPADRSDDLVSCEPGILRQLIMNLLQHLKTGSQSSVIIADCFAIPMATIRAAAVLANHCVVEASSSDGFPLDAAQKEINLLLAELPHACQAVNLQPGNSVFCEPGEAGKENVS